MKHLGDITKIHGNEAPPVNAIIGGSPCQDLSVAGKRAGLAGARSGLYMEQIRITKEMRSNDEANGRSGVDVRPRYMVWENVPGAFSSNKGEDFRAVLEEAAHVADETAVIPRPANGKWSNSGAIVADGWSIAWRVHDAQFWGVPQRRRRISLVADFAGQSAPEILFERESVSGDSEPCGEAWQGIAADSETGAGVSSGYGESGIGYWGEGIKTLRAEGENRPSSPSNVIVQASKCYGICSYASNSMKSDNPHSGIYEASTSRTLDLNGGSPACNQGGIAVVQPAAFTPCGGDSMKANVVCLDMTHACDVIRDCGEIVPSLQAIGEYKESDVSSSCKMRDYKDATDLVTYSVDCRNNAEHEEIHGTLQAKENGGQSLNYTGAVRENHTLYPLYIVRRLTPLECERLQGYQDGWTDIGEWVDSAGKKHKDADSPRYKALGNSIALPFWRWMLNRMAAYLPEHATMASLFDGIGGFPTCWEAIHGNGTAVWASEIEEFPITVTKIHFSEEAK